METVIPIADLQPIYSVAEVDRTIPVRDVATLGNLLERGLTTERMVARLGLPAILHNRQSGPEMLEMLGRFPARERPGVFHSFTENAAYGKRALDLGYFVSFSGMITFRAADNIREAAAGLPLEAMLVETDTPFLAPVPHRGKSSEPAFVVETAKKLAEVKGTDLATVAAATTANFERLFCPLSARERAG